MKTITVTVYTFDELSDTAKARACEWWRQTDTDAGAWNDESKNSIEVFCDEFRVTLRDWSVGAYAPYYFKTDATNANFRGRKLAEFDRDAMPTGYCLDCDLWQTFADEFKKTGDAKAAFDAALHAGFKAWRDDLEGQLEDEYIGDFLEANGFGFLANGAPA